MMNAAPSLVRFITGLESDPYFAITVSNADTGEPIVKDATKEKLIANYGGIAEFFNELYAKGQKKLCIQERRKNGLKAFINKGGTVCISMTPTETETPTPEQAVPQTQATYIPSATPMAQPVLPQGMGMDMQGLGMGGFGLMGLNAPDAIYKTMAYPELKLNHDKLKEKNEELKDEVRDLKMQIHQLNFSDSKAQGNKEMLNGIVETLSPIAIALLQGRGGGAMPMQGLNAPEADVSETRRQAMEVMDSLSDIYDGYILATLVGIANNAAFADELTGVLKKHQLIN